MKKQLALFMALAVAASTAQAVVTNTTQIGGDSSMRDSSWTALVTTNSAVSPVEYSMSWGADAKYAELSNVVFTVTARADNALDVLNLGTTHLAVDSSARQLVDTNNTGRINLDESITLKFSYSDPDGKLLGLKMDSIAPYWNTGAAEETLFTDGSAVYAVADSDNTALFDYDSTGLAQIDLNTTNNNWFMQVYQTNDLTTSGMGAFKIEYIADTEFVPDPVLPPFGVVELGSTWTYARSAPLAEANNYVSAIFTNGADSTNRRFTQDGAGDLGAQLQVGETLTISFTAKIGDALPLTGADRIFRASVWDSGSAVGNGFSFRVDYGAIGGTTVQASVANIPSAGYVGNIVGAQEVTTDVVPSNALVSQGSESDFVMTIVRTGDETADYSLSYDDVTVSNSYTGVTMDSVNAFGFRMNSISDNHLIITNLLIEITNPDFEIDYFGDWAAANGLTIGVNDALDDDAENGGIGDGVVNLLEYALGGDPLVDDAATILPEQSMDGSYLNYVYARRLDAAARGLDYNVYSMLDLVLGPLTNATEEAGSVVVDSEFESVTNRVPTASEDTQFMGLEVGISE